MMHFCNPNDVLPSVWKKSPLKDKIKWRCEIFVRNKEWHGLSTFFPWNSTCELVFGMKFSSPLSTELTRYSVFPVHVPCLRNWLASLRGNCVLHLEEVHNWGDPAPVMEIPLESASPAREQTEPLWDQADAQIRYCLCARNKQRYQKAPWGLWSTSSSWIKKSTDKKCAACVNG